MEQPRALLAGVAGLLGEGQRLRQRLLRGTQLQHNLGEAPPLGVVIPVDGMARDNGNRDTSWHSELFASENDDARLNEYRAGG